MKARILYYVIGSVDVYSDNVFTGSKIEDVIPDFFNWKNGKKRVFRQTEGSKEAEEPATKHRKYVGIINAKQLKQIKEDFYLQGTCQTMGTLTEYGWLDAISWDLDITDCYHTDCTCNLYVSPIIDFKDAEKIESILNKLPDFEKKIKIDKIQLQLQKALNRLKDRGKNRYSTSIEIDLLQCELEMS